MLYTPSGVPATDYSANSPYQPSAHISQAPQVNFPEYGLSGGRQYNSELGPGLGRKSPARIAASLAWLNTYPFLLGIIGVAILAVILGVPEAALVGAYILPFLLVRYFWRYLRYANQTAQVYAMG